MFDELYYKGKPVAWYKNHKPIYWKKDSDILVEETYFCYPLFIFHFARHLALLLDRSANAVRALINKWSITIDYTEDHKKKI